MSTSLIVTALWSVFWVGVLLLGCSPVFWDVVSNSGTDWCTAKGGTYRVGLFKNPQTGEFNFTEEVCTVRRP